MKRFEVSQETSTIPSGSFLSAKAILSGSIMIKITRISSIIIIGTGIFLSGSVIHGTGQENMESLLDSFRLVNDFIDQNEVCFRCHGEPGFLLPGREGGPVLHRTMNQDLIIKREEYYEGNHKSFACLDCHSSEYEEFPHPVETGMEEHWGCLDCHGHDEKYAHFKFEMIEEEFLQSVHYLAGPEEFSCWKCHPHSYHISIRNEENLRTAIAYDNAICLSCHADSSQPEPDIMQTHDWLPNETLHFRNVRCIECHTKINDSIMVAHLVQPKERSVRNCTDCHSANSILLATLYKYRSKDARRELGFINGVAMNDVFVIVANRNKLFNRISLIFFSLTMLGIGIHICFRIRNKV